jgi:putative two-component system response regulator
MYLEDEGYHRFVTTTNSGEALELLRHHLPDVALVDLMMPQVDGFDLLRDLQRDPTVQRIPVLVLTSTADAETKHRALELGATDLLAKPVDPSELGLRLKNTLRAKSYRDGLRNYSAQLEDQVRQRTRELEIAQRQIIHCLARAAEYRDDDTGKHVLRVGQYAAILAAQLGADMAEADLLEMAAQLHDIGKIGIPDEILLKPGKFEPGEFAVMQRHCELGVSILRGNAAPDLPPIAVDQIAVPILRLAMTIAATHHERWDGSGYPRGLRGNEIPLCGRIVAVADVFDALSSKRPYKQPMPLEKCLTILREGSGSHFDPDVIDVFFAVLDKILAVRSRNG